VVQQAPHPGGAPRPSAAVVVEVSHVAIVASRVAAEQTEGAPSLPGIFPNLPMGSSGSRFLTGGWDLLNPSVPNAVIEPTKIGKRRCSPRENLGPNASTSAAETIEQRLGGGRIMEPSRAPGRSKGAWR
jgi:hypothetical protein